MGTALDRVAAEWARLHGIEYKSQSELRRLWHNRFRDRPRCYIEYRLKGEQHLHRVTFKTTDDAEQFIIDNNLQQLAEKVGDGWPRESIEAAAKASKADHFYIQVIE